MTVDAPATTPAWPQVRSGREIGRELVMVVHAHYPVGEPRVEREAKAARRSGSRVSVICLRDEGERRKETIDGIEVERLPIKHARGAGFARSLLEYLAFTLFAAIKLLRRRANSAVFHVHAPPDFLIFAAAPLRLRGARVLLDIHDLSPHMYGARFRPGARTSLIVGALRRIQLVACSLADAVITVHEPYRQELLADGIPPRKVTVVMNSADEELIERVRAQRSKAPIERPFTVAYHGTINAWYGVDIVVDAFAQILEDHPSAKALILGDGDALLDVRARTATLGIDHAVEISGRYLPIESALQRVSNATCGVIPNRPSTLNRFALSSKLFEYVALGIPAVVARLETLSAHFAEDEVTFFEPGDADSLAAALRWVATNPQDASDKAARAQARSEAYGWHRQAASYLSLLGFGESNGSPDDAGAYLAQ